MIDTKVKTKSVTNTQLVVATMAAFMAGGLAFASVPAQNRVAAAPKCGVNSYSVLSLARGCASGQFTGIDFACHDGSRHQHRPGVCTPLAQLKNTANATCANRCAGVPQPPVVEAGILSVGIDTAMPLFENDRYALAGTEKFLAGRVRLDAQHENIDIRDLTLRFSTTTLFSNIRDSIDTVSLYTSSNLSEDTLLATAGLRLDQVGDIWYHTAPLQNLRYQATKGVPSYLYIALNMNPIEPQFEFYMDSIPSTSFKILVHNNGNRMTGSASGNNIIPEVRNTLTNEISVTPVKVNVDSEFRGGDFVGGHQDIFSFRVTADSGENSDLNDNPPQVRLSQIQLELTTNVGTALSSNTSNLELCRVDSGNCIDLMTDRTLSDEVNQVRLVNLGNGTSTINFTYFRDRNGQIHVEDEFIEDGESVEFVVRGGFANTQDAFAQVRLLNLNNKGLSYATVFNNVRYHYFYDLRKDAPRNRDYPNIVGQSLN